MSSTWMREKTWPGLSMRRAVPAFTWSIGAAAGPVDAGQAKDVDGRARLHAHRLPGALGRQALDAARLAGLGGVSSSTQPPP